MEALVSLTRVPPLEIDLWKSQNIYYQVVEALSGTGQTRSSGGRLDQFRSLGEWLGVAVSPRSPELPCSPQDKPRDRMLPN